MKRLSFLAEVPFPNYKDLIMIMAIDKPAAIRLLIQEYNRLGEFDFISELIILDSIQVYGSSIVKLYYDIAKTEENFDSLLLDIQLHKVDIVHIKRQIYGKGINSKTA